jgi:hypothetical protein
MLWIYRGPVYQLGILEAYIIMDISCMAQMDVERRFDPPTMYPIPYKRQRESHGSRAGKRLGPPINITTIVIALIIRVLNLYLTKTTTWLAGHVHLFPNVQPNESTTHFSNQMCEMRKCLLSSLSLSLPLSLTWHSVMILSFIVKQKSKRSISVVLLSAQSLSLSIYIYIHTLGQK